MVCYEITRINKNELERDLYFYYIDEKYKPVFTDIELGEFKVILNIFKYLNCRDTDEITLSYMLGYLEKPECSIEYFLMNEMIHEIAIRKRAEEISPIHLRIYGMNPNRAYTLERGFNPTYNENSEWRIVTDGNATTRVLQKSEEDKEIFRRYPSKKDDTYYQLIDVEKEEIQVSKATFAIVQGLINDQIVCADIHSESLDIKELRQLATLSEIDKPLRLIRMRKDK